jgi:hypothetical protein
MAEAIPDRNQANETLKQEHPSRQRLILTFDRELPSRELAAVLHHIERCAQCELCWAKLAKLSHGIAAAEREDSAPVFELKLPSGAEVDRFSAERNGSPTLMRMVGLVAAVLTLAVGLWLLMRSPSQPGPAISAAGGKAEEHEGSATQPKVAAPKGALAPQRVSAGNEKHLAAVVRPSKRVLRNSQVTAPSAAVAAQRDQDSKVVFWALPYSNPALTAEGVHVVHVALPREAFLMAGVPVDELPGVSQREVVPAEVLLGSDGLPTAIRPIQYKPSRRQAGYNLAP